MKFIFTSSTTQASAANDFLYIPVSWVIRPQLILTPMMMVDVERRDVKQKKLSVIWWLITQSKLAVSVLLEHFLTRNKHVYFGRFFFLFLLTLRGSRGPLVVSGGNQKGNSSVRCIWLVRLQRQAIRAPTSRRTFSPHSRRKWSFLLLNSDWLFFGGWTGFIYVDYFFIFFTFFAMYLETEESFISAARIWTNWMNEVVWSDDEVNR